MQNPIHDGTAETALPVDESTFYKDLGDLGNTAGLSEDGHDGTAETELPVDESTFYEDLGDLGNTAGLSEDGYDFYSGSWDNCPNMRDLEKPINFPPEADLLPERLYGFEVSF